MSFSISRRRTSRRLVRAVPLVVALLSSVSVVRTVLGQTSASQTPATGSDPATPQLLPVPLVISGFPAPAHSVDWTHYQHMDECVDVMAWTQAAENFDRIDRSAALDAQRNRDTTRANPWAPLPVATRDSTQQCLRRFALSTVPEFESPDMMKVAITVQADPLVAAFVAHHIAAAHDVPRAQVAVLDTVIQWLMHSPGLPGQPVATQPSPEYLELARRYDAQLNALGRPALVQQLITDQALLMPAQFTYAVDTLLTHLHLEQQRVRQLSPDEVHTQYGITLDTVELVQQGVEARLQWLQTGDADAFRRFVTVAQQTVRLPAGHRALISAVAPPMMGASCFSSPATTTPSATLTPPLLGAPSLIVFLGTDEESAAGDSRVQQYRDLRRLHVEFPRLRIVLVKMLHGAYRHRWLLEHPTEEATLIHQELADSLGIPGSLCVVQPAYQTLPNGWIEPLLSPLGRAYDFDSVDGIGGFLIDLQGHIVDAIGFTDVYPTILRHMQQ